MGGPFEIRVRAWVLRRHFDGTCLDVDGGWTQRSERTRYFSTQDEAWAVRENVEQISHGCYVTSFDISPSHFPFADMLDAISTNRDAEVRVPGWREVASDWIKQADEQTQLILMPLLAEHARLRADALKLQNRRVLQGRYTEPRDTLHIVWPQNGTEPADCTVSFEIVEMRPHVEDRTTATRVFEVWLLDPEDDPTESR